jgi:hypothetical protein
MWMRSNTLERRDARWHAVGSAKFHMPLALMARAPLLPNMASTTSRSARFVVDSCQPPLNFCHRN